MMLEKGIADQYDEQVLGMLEKGEQKSWSQYEMHAGDQSPYFDDPDFAIPVPEYNKINPWGKAANAG